MDVDPKLLGRAAERYRDPWWRLCHLHHIVVKEAPEEQLPGLEATVQGDAWDQQGMLQRFQPNWAQRHLFFNRHHRQIVLKARQLGITTFWCMYMLDKCFFNSYTSAGIIADRLDNAKKFLRKILISYQRFPEYLRAAVPLVTDSKTTLEWANGSRIEVGTSLRSDTCHILHVSEFGRICAERPDKAEEVVTGGLNTVPTHGEILIESTAMGKEGLFYRYCQSARQLKAMQRALSPLQYRFNFFPWWLHPEYAVPHDQIIIPGPFKEYFDKLERQLKRKITPQQRAWYVLMAEKIEGNMKREFPSTPDEAFAASQDGTYYASTLLWMREKGRITKVPYNPALPVDTWWDVGYDDHTAIVFTQLVGYEPRVIDFYEHMGEGFEWYYDVLQKKGYRYGMYVSPHDTEHHRWVPGETDVQQIARGWGVHFHVQPLTGRQGGIERTRHFLKLCWIDEEKCSELIRHLENYKREFNMKLNDYASTPRHDEHSHAADAMRYCACGWEQYAGRVQRGTVAVAPPTTGMAGFQ